MLSVYSSHLFQFNYLWGPAGQLDWLTYAARPDLSVFSLFRYSSSPLYGDFLVFASFVISVCMVVGVFPRISCFLFAISTFAMLDRDPFTFDGGSKLLIMLAVYLIFADTSKHLTLLPDPTFGIRHQNVAFGSWLKRTVHNVAVFVIAGQICLVYYWAVFYKLAGRSWRDGSALVYILQSERYTLPWLAHLLLSHSVFLALLAYGTLILQGAFPFLMWSSRAKPYLVGAMIALHLGIIVLMGLVTFSTTMIAADLFLLNEPIVVTILDRLRSASARIGRLLKFGKVQMPGQLRET